MAKKTAKKEKEPTLSVENDAAVKAVREVAEKVEGVREAANKLLGPVRAQLGEEWAEDVIMQIYQCASRIRRIAKKRASQMRKAPEQQGEEAVNGR